MLQSPWPQGLAEGSSNSSHSNEVTVDRLLVVKQLCDSQHLHTYIHTYIHTNIHTSIHTDIYTYVHTYIHTYMPACMHASLPSRHTSIHTRAYATDIVYIDLSCETIVLIVTATVQKTVTIYQQQSSWQQTKDKRGSNSLFWSARKREEHPGFLKINFMSN